MKNMALIKEQVATAIQIRKEMHKIYAKHGVKVSINEVTPNPYHDQVDENFPGIICEYYYGIPCSIYTPIGHLKIVDGFTPSDEKTRAAIDEIMEVFGFTLSHDRVDNHNGTFGPWYAITKLPWNPGVTISTEFKRRPTHFEYEDYDLCILLYKDIVNQFDTLLTKYR